MRRLDSCTPISRAGNAELSVCIPISRAGNAELSVCTPNSRAGNAELSVCTHQQGECGLFGSSHAVLVQTTYAALDAITGLSILKEMAALYANGATLSEFVARWIGLYNSTAEAGPICVAVDCPFGSSSTKQKSSTGGVGRVQKANTAQSRSATNKLYDGALYVNPTGSLIHCFCRCGAAYTLASALSLSRLV